MATDLKKFVNDVLGIKLYWFQLRFLHACLKKKRVLGCFSRQTGKSMTIAIATVLLAIGHPNGHIVLCAPTDRQAGELFIKITNFLRDSQFNADVESITQRSAKMKNGCRITALPSGDDGGNIRGMTADVLILEEAAKIKDSIVAEVLMPMVAATQGSVIKISTPMGMNHFYQSHVSDDWDVHIVPYKEAVHIKHFEESFIREQAIVCGGWNSVGFRTEYCAEFISDQDAYFGNDLIDKCIKECPTLSGPKEGGQYYMGVDVARKGKDACVITIIEKGSDLMPHRLVWSREIPEITLDVLIEELFALDQQWGFNKIYIDESGLGSGVTDVLKRMVGESTKMRQTSGAMSYAETDRVIGVTFTLKSKMDIYSNLRVLMEQGRLVFPNIQKLVFQLKDFRYETIDGSDRIKLHHSEGGHDDWPDSLSLAARGLKEQECVLMW